MQTVNVESGDFDKVVLNSELPVVVDFWAEWCAPCKMLAPVMEQLAETLSGKAVVVKVDADTSTDVVERYGIRGLPTVAIFNKGKLETRITGPKSLQHYLELVEAISNRDDPAAQEALENARFVQLLMGEGTVDELRHMLIESPERASAPIEFAGTAARPVAMQLLMRNDERLALLLEFNPELSLHDHVGLGHVDELKSAIGNDPGVVDLKDGQGQVPLVFACFTGQVECASLLLDAGATTELGPGLPSLLHLVAGIGQLEIAKLLVDKGLSPDIVDADGKRPIDYALKSAHQDVADYLDSL